MANAVFEQADAVMLSGETSVGAYPVKCIEIMDRIATRIEESGVLDIRMVLSWIRCTPSWLKPVHYWRPM